jgi:hypothetical protein
MANDCSNRILIHCDNEQILEKIHGLFYEGKDGEIRYTMMKLVPIPSDRNDSEDNPLYGFITPLAYWGTKSDFWCPEPNWQKNDFILKYYTANGPNKLWIEELVCCIMEMLDEFSGEKKPKIYVKHLFDVCQVMTAGYMYWEPGMEMKYEYSTEENLNEKVINEFKTVAKEQEREMEVFEFHIEDHLEYEPIEDDFEYRFQRYGWNMLWID